MAATPKAGVIYFKGLNSGQTFARSVYNPDVLNTLIRIDNGSGTPTSTTTGSDFITYDEPVSIYDAAFVTGIVDTANLRAMANYTPSQFTINWAAHVNTLNNRPFLNITYKAGTRISFQSVA